jgi:hypothetical protein
VPARSPLDRDDLNVAAEIRGDATDKPAATVKRKSSHGWGTLPKRSVVRLRKIIETLRPFPDFTGKERFAVANSYERRPRIWLATGHERVR